MFTGPKWKIALYLDEKANNDQKDALTKIFTAQAGGEFFVEILPRIGEILGIRSVPIEFNIEGKKKRSIRIPSFVEMEIEGLTGRDPNIESKVVNPAFSNTPGVLIPLLLAPQDTRTMIMGWNGIIVEKMHFTVDLLMSHRWHTLSL